jgi:Spy/CpxP family protein refolding chaperone
MMKQKILQNKSGEFKEMMEKRLKKFPDTKMQGFIKSLNLLEEQITEIKKIRLDFQKVSLELNNKVRIKEVLTPEQLAKLPLGVPMQRFGAESFEFNRRFKGNYL